MNSEDSIDAIFSALSDRTRRQVLGRLARSDSVTATELATGMDVSRQAIVKHLQALSSAGFATTERSGREVRYSLDPAPLREAARWIADEGGRWDDRLGRLRALLEDRRGAP
jgi:DNA-binding transcriptional ArsR family regulator